MILASLVLSINMLALTYHYNLVVGYSQSSISHSVVSLIIVHIISCTIVLPGLKPVLFDLVARIFFSHFRQFRYC